MRKDRHVSAATGPGPAPQEGDRQRLQDRIMQVSRFATIGEMAAGVAHELNQPLTAIANYARACENLLRRSDGDRADVLEALGEIGHEANRAAEIIRRLRQLVRSQPSERLHTDLNDVVLELAALMQGDARVHDVRLRFELGQSLPGVIVDRVQVQHVLLNLLRNALEALTGSDAQERDVVIRTLAADDGSIELSVADTGPGVARYVVDRLFAPFVTTKSHGTGLGLATSQSIVRAHDGTLGYRPNVPGGACFFMRFPARPG